MRILALETTDKTGSVAALGDDNLLAELSLDHTQRSAQSLAPAMHALLEQVGWLPRRRSIGGRLRRARLVHRAAGRRDHRQGLRLCCGGRCPGHRHPGGHRGRGPGQRQRCCWTVMDAQRGEVVARCFDRDAAGTFRARWPAATRLRPTPGWLELDAWRRRDRPRACTSWLDRLPPGVEALDRRYWSPRRPLSVRLAAHYYAHGRRDDLWRLVPHYFRRSAAEEKWDACGIANIVSSRGLRDVHLADRRIAGRRPTARSGGWPRRRWLAAVLLTGTKLGIGLWTNSLGILSEAAHSGLDLVAAAVTLWAVRVSSRPADREHTYGHGKFENLSALFETVLLLVTCVWIIHEAAARLFFHKPFDLNINAWAFLVVILVDRGRFFAIARAEAGRRQVRAARPWRPTPCTSPPTSGRRPWCCWGFAACWPASDSDCPGWSRPTPWPPWAWR